MSPKYFFSQFEEDYYVLVMECLDGKIGLQKNGTSLEDAKFILKEWSCFQKKFLHSRSDESFKKEKKLDFANIVDLCIHFFNDVKNYPEITTELIDKHTLDFLDSWKISLEVFKTIKPNEENNLETFNHLIDKFNEFDLKTLYSNALKDSLNSIQSVIHNDFRADHFCFVNDKLVMLDWQAVCVGIPLIDVAKLLTENISHFDLTNSWKDLLKIYHENMFSDEKSISYQDTVKMLNICSILNIGRILYLTKLFSASLKEKDFSDPVAKLFINYVTNVLWGVFNFQ
jgi:thiamine kinase-like enzyme